MTADNEEGNVINLPPPNEDRPVNSLNDEAEETGDKCTTNNNGDDVESLSEEFKNNNNDTINDDAAMAHVVGESLNDTNNIIRINNAAIERAISESPINNNTPDAVQVPPPSLRRASIPGAHHIEGPAAGQLSINSPQVSGSGAARENIDDELDRLGITRVTAEAVPVDIEADCNQEADTAPPLPQPDNVIPAEAIKSINICGYEVSQSSLKSVLIACALTLAVTAIIVVPILVTTNNEQGSAIEETTITPETTTDSEEIFAGDNNTQGFMGKPPSGKGPPGGLPSGGDGDVILPIHGVTFLTLLEFKNCPGEGPSKLPSCEDVWPYNDLDTNNVTGIGATLSTAQSFDDPDSPQSKAKEWIYTAKVNNPFARQNVRWIQERYFLAVLFYSTGGKGWTRNSNLLEMDNHCDIPEIKCHEEFSMITVLDMSKNNLQGTLPTMELMAPTIIEKLDLSGNPSLGGSLPSNLPMSLEEISILNTNITGSL